jgi:hypothetical protein
MKTLLTLTLLAIGISCGAPAQGASPTVPSNPLKGGWPSPDRMMVTELVVRLKPKEVGNEAETGTLSVQSDRGDLLAKVPYRVKDQGSVEMVLPRPVAVPELPRLSVILQRTIHSPAVISTLIDPGKVIFEHHDRVLQVSIYAKVAGQSILVFPARTEALGDLFQTSLRMPLQVPDHLASAQFNRQASAHLNRPPSEPFNRPAPPQFTTQAPPQFNPQGP